MRHFYITIALVISALLSPTLCQAQTSTDWHMAGANPSRTSWVSEEVRGNLSVDWYQPIEPYIPYKIQPIFYQDTAYISTAKGLYAFDLASNVLAGSSRVKWIYPTQLPLGHSPTISTIDGKVVAYVGGFDRTIHAIDTASGEAMTGYTPYIAGAGFENNPLVISDSHTANTPTIIAGNRDGKLYALHARTGAKVWEFSTDGPITYSPAYKDGVIYVASNDLYAYAIDISDGSPIWKSQKFEYSAGFFSFWPVIYDDPITGQEYVSFTGATNYRPQDGGDHLLNKLDMQFFVPFCQPASDNCSQDIIWGTQLSSGDELFDDNTTIMDLNQNLDFLDRSVANYFEEHPHRRHVFILNTQTGEEFTYDSDNDGILEYAPFTWSGNTTYSGNRYPALINQIDSIYYQPTLYRSNNWISRSDPVGWKFGTSIVSKPFGGSHALDEPQSYASGGTVMYWSLCCNREAGAVDLSLPLSATNRSWQYYSYDLMSKAPDYMPMYNDGDVERYNTPEGCQADAAISSIFIPSLRA